MVQPWIITLISLVAVFIAIASLSVGYHLHQSNLRLRDEINLTVQRLGQFENDMAALCKASTGEGQHVIKLAQQMRGLSERQDALELRGSSEQPYARASQLAQDGASIDDLVNSCGLTRAEAELVVMLHGAYGRG